MSASRALALVLLILFGPVAEGQRDDDRETVIYGSGSRLQGTWRPLASMPEPRYKHSAAGPLEGRLYVTGGRNSIDDTVVTVYAYDIGVDAWDEVASMIEPRSGHASAVCRGKLFVFGGEPALSTVEAYDPDSDEWSSRSPMPVGLQFLTAETWRDTLIYLIGGEQNSTLQCSVPYIYDPTEDAWTQGTAFYTPRRSPGSAVVGDTLVVWAGYRHLAVYPRDMEIGVIDSSDPSSIDWHVERGPPAGGFLGTGGDAVTCHDGLVVVSSSGLFEDTRHWERWTFTKYLRGDLWTTEGDRPEPGGNAESGVGSASVFYSPGGWNDVEASARFFALSFPDGQSYGRDMGVRSVDVPAYLPEDTVLFPQATVRNYGQESLGFAVRCEIEPGGYESTIEVTNLEPGGEIPVVFPEDFEFERGYYWVTVRTELAGDERTINDALVLRAEASEWYHDWLFRDDGVPVILGSWIEAGNGWGTRFRAPHDLWIDSLACCFNPDFVGGTDSTAKFRIYGADSIGVLDTAQLRIDTIVSGIHYSWNKVGIDTSRMGFEEDEYFFVFYVQQAPYPDAPGMFGDVMLNHPHDQWFLLNGSFGYPTGFPGDHAIRARGVATNGVAEWLGTPPIERDFWVSYSRSASGIEFLLRTGESLGPLTLRVYDALGRCVRVLSEDLVLRAEERRLTWNLKDGLERRVPIGIYFLNVHGPIIRRTIKVFKGD
jgi:hypothetical protein